MTSHVSRSLGLNLERGPAPSNPRLGSILDPTNFEFPVISKNVAGAWADVAVHDDPALARSPFGVRKAIVIEQRQRGKGVEHIDEGFFQRISPTARTIRRVRKLT